MLTIAWDVDDVLNDLTAAWLQAYNHEASTNFAYSDLKQNPPHAMLGISLDDYRSSLDSFREQYFDSLKPNPAVLNWFREHGHLARHLAVSAVPMKLAPLSAQWTLRHFGHWIRSFHFVPSPRTDDTHPHYDEGKASFLKWLGNVDILVEDNEANATAAAHELGIDAILYPQPWNRAVSTYLQGLLDTLSLNVARGRPAPALGGAMSSRHGRLDLLTEKDRLGRDDPDPQKKDHRGGTTRCHQNADGETTSAHSQFVRPTWESLEVRQGRNLPHWSCDHAIYHVVMRLADSLPAKVLDKWKHERDDILENARQLGRELTEAEEKRLQHLFSSEIEACLDRGIGECWLRSPQIAEIVQNALKHGEGDKYKLHAWCVMPSHVHVLVEPGQNVELDNIVKSWTAFTGRMANHALKRRGRFWQPEPYDHIIRSSREYSSQIEYIYKNSEKAGMPDWPWRFRI